MIKDKKEKRTKRHARIRAKVKGTAQIPRLSVYKSNKNIIAQLIDDDKDHTMFLVSSQKMTEGTPKEQAQKVGREVAEQAKNAKIESVVFDRGGFIYTGKIKALADAAREAGLKF